MTDIVADAAPGYKRCITCGEQKLITEFHFQRHAPRPGQERTDAPRGRYRGNCKKCQREYMRQRRIDKVSGEGVEYLEKEAKRVRGYYRNEERLEFRRAVDRARYTAYAALRERHPQEYEELFTQARVYEGVPDDTPH